MFAKGLSVTNIERIRGEQFFLGGFAFSFSLEISFFFFYSFSLLNRNGGRNGDRNAFRARSTTKSMKTNLSSLEDI